MENKQVLIIENIGKPISMNRFSKFAFVVIDFTFQNFVVAPIALPVSRFNCVVSYQNIRFLSYPFDTVRRKMILQFG